MALPPRPGGGGEGCCCYPEPNPDGTRNCGMTSSEENCGWGGIFTPGPCPLCPMTSPLGEYLAAATREDDILASAVRPIYTIMNDFRSIILRHSALGRELLDLYKVHAESAARAVYQRDQLASRWLTLLARGILFAQDILRAYSYDGRHVAAGELRIESTEVEDLTEFIGEFRRVSPSEEFSEVLAWAEKIIDQLSGMTARQVLQLLDVEETGDAPSAA